MIYLRSQHTKFFKSLIRKHNFPFKTCIESLFSHQLLYTRHQVQYSTHTSALQNLVFTSKGLRTCLKKEQMLKRNLSNISFNTQQHLFYLFVCVVFGMHLKAINLKQLLRSQYNLHPRMQTSKFSAEVLDNPTSSCLQLQTLQCLT